MRNAEQERFAHDFVYLPTSGKPGVANVASVYHEEDKHGLQRAFIDRDALNSLQRVIEGPIKSDEDLRGAELALRAFVFHDDVDIIFPGFQIRDTKNPTPHNINGQTIQTKYDASIRWPMYKAPQSLEKMMEHVDLHRIIYSEIVYSCGHKILTKESPVRHISNLTKCNPSCLTEEFYEKYLALSDIYRRRFIATIPACNSPAYFGNKILAEEFDNGPGNRGNNYFRIIDDDWNQSLKQITQAAGLNISIDFLLAIVLHRANSRDEIPVVVENMREEWADARRQLWDLFDEALLRCSHMEDQLKQINKLQASAKSIIPKSFSGEDRAFPIRFISNAARAVVNWAGIKSILDLPGENIGFSSNLHHVDASRIISNELRELPNISELLSKHLGQHELQLLQANTIWHW